MAELTPSRPSLLIEQRMAANTNFGGQAPATAGPVAAAATDLDLMRTFPADLVQGGLFTPPQTESLAVVREVRIAVTSATGWAIAVVDAAGTSRRLAGATGLSEVAVHYTAAIHLGLGEKLSVTTTGAGGGATPYAMVTVEKWSRPDAY